MRRVEAPALKLRERAIEEPASAIEPVPMTVEIAFALGRVPRSSVPDLPGRAVAATVLALGLPLVTHDGLIRASNSIQTIC